MKIKTNNIAYTTYNVILKNETFSIDEVKNNFINLSKEDFIKTYNLSYRSYVKLVKDLKLNSLRQCKTLVSKFLDCIDRETFEKDFKTYSLKDLSKKYNISETTLNKIIKKLNLHLTIDEIQQKVKNTNKKKYGTEYYSQTKAYINQVKKTKLEKYGNENFINAEKMKQTCLERYGSTSPAGNEEVIQKMKQTCLERYGALNYFSSADFSHKAKQTKLEKYGNENFTNRDKAMKTNLEKYGTIYPNQSEIVKQKRLETVKNRYGVDNVWQSEEVKDKIRKVCQEKYGVDYPCMTKQCRESTIYNDSSCNLEFEQLLKDNNISYEREFPINTKQFDFKVDDILIEINPFATHNSTWGWRGNKNKGLDVYYHLNKTKLAKENGFRCIHIWDWDDKEKVIELLKNNIRTTIYARKCVIKNVEINEERLFLNKYHLQNYAKSKISLGLYYKDNLISIMTFNKPRYNRNYEWELVRYCTIFNVIGGAKRLFKYFIDTYHPKSVISYCDLSKFTGDVYKKLNFTSKSQLTKPSKHWYNIKTKQHITDNLLRQFGYDGLFHTNYGKGTSNVQLMLEHNFVEIYDCGQETYVWKQ